jgi:hypothetical protein
MINYKYNFHKISKRYISDLTELKNLLDDISDSNRKILKQFNVEPNPILDSKYKECTKIDDISYETDIKTEKFDEITDNLDETAIILEKIKFLNNDIKFKNKKIEVEVIENNTKNNDNNIDILNNVIKDKEILNNINNKSETLINNIDKNKGFFSDITNFIYSLPDMLNTPGRIILVTIGAGIVLGGTYYFGTNIKNFIFKPNNYTTIQPQIPINITIPQVQTPNPVKETFFKQVGERIIKLLDILINKYQFKKYK